MSDASHTESSNENNSAPEALIEQLESVLATERDAIQRVDADGVAEAAKTKEALFLALTNSNIEIRKDLAPRLQALIAELRHNVVLLAHGRDCLKDALFAIHGELVHDETSPARPRQSRPRTRISVTG